MKRKNKKDDLFAGAKSWIFAVALLSVIPIMGLFLGGMGGFFAGSMFMVFILLLVYFTVKLIRDEDAKYGTR